MMGVTKKGYFRRHAKSSAAIFSLAIHGIVLVAAVSFVAVKVVIKDDQLFEPKPVQRPRVQLQKLQLPVTVMKKKIPPPKLRQRLVTPKQIKPNQLIMPEVTGVSGGTGFLDGGGGLGGDDFQSFNVSFFGVKGNGRRLVFIIEYSNGMQYKEREPVMRREASRVIKELPEGVEFAVIFFCGPAWSATTNLRDELDKWVVTRGDYPSYRPRDWDSIMSQIHYMKASRSSKATVIRAIQETPLMGGGTIHDHPLFMALSMDPLPNTIFLMAVGNYKSSRGINALRDMVRQLKEQGREVPQIHTVCFPVLDNSLLEQMAELTNGEYRVIRPEEYIAKHERIPNRLKGIKSDFNIYRVIEQVGPEDYPLEYQLE